MTGEILQDRTMTLTLPEGVPVGRVRVTVSIEPETEPRRRTSKEFLEAEFFGNSPLRADLPATGKGFREWCRRLEREAVL
ncbi:hypothetical protein EON81_08440 [bacterium]|nr:MAG: hypothetical protein EON81_08440 [bacterium]